MIYVGQKTKFIPKGGGSNRAGLECLVDYHFEGEGVAKMIRIVWWI